MPPAGDYTGRKGIASAGTDAVPFKCLPAFYGSHCVTSFLPRRRGVLIPLWRNFVGAFGVVDKVKEEGFATAQK